MSRVESIKPIIYHHGLFDRFNQLRVSKPLQAILPYVPTPVKAALKAGVKSFTAQSNPSPWALNEIQQYQVSEEINALHQCSVQLPSYKAHSLLGFQPPIPFLEGMRRSCAWLHFAGYSILPQHSPSWSSPNRSAAFSYSLFLAFAYCDNPSPSFCLFTYQSINCLWSMNVIASFCSCFLCLAFLLLLFSTLNTVNLISGIYAW